MRFRHLLASAVVLAMAGTAFAQLPAKAQPAPPQPALTTKAKVPAAARPVTQSQVKIPMAANASSPAAVSTSAAPASASSSAAAVNAAEQLAKLEAVPTRRGDAGKGQGKAGACGACHGLDGNSTDAQYPKLAGQNEAYIVRQLMNFKSGTRVNAIMSGMAAPLTPQDMHDIGAYFASQKSLPGVADETLADSGGKLFHEGDAGRGIPACMACHGPDGHGNPGAAYPQLAGQHADYVQQQLQAWQGGDNAWGADAHARIMPAIAQKLTKAEIAAVSSYVEGLHTAQPGEMARGPEAPPAQAAGSAAPTASAAGAAPAAASSGAKPAGSGESAAKSATPGKG